MATEALDVLVPLMILQNIHAAIVVLYSKVYDWRSR